MVDNIVCLLDPFQIRRKVAINWLVIIGMAAWSFLVAFHANDMDCQCGSLRCC